MTYKERLVWQTQNQRQVVYDLKRRLRLAEEQLNKAIVDADLKMVKVWGAECFKLENDIPFHEFDLNNLEKELETK